MDINETGTTGLAQQPVDDVTNANPAAEDATDTPEETEVHDRLAPPTIDSNDAIAVDTQIISPETQSARRIVFRMPRAGVIDLESSYLAMQLDVQANSFSSAAEQSYVALPSLVGINGVIREVVVRIGAQEVQRVEEFPLWLASHVPELTISQQQFVRSHLDLSGNAYNDQVLGATFTRQNQWALERLRFAPKDITGFQKAEFTYQVNGRNMQSHATLPLTALIPSLGQSMKRYPAMVAEQLSIELIIDTSEPRYLVAASGITNPTVEAGDVKQRMPDAAAFPNSAFPTRISVADCYCVVDFLQMPAPILAAVNAQVEKGLVRHMYNKIVQKRIPVLNQDGLSTRDVPIRSDNSIISAMTFLRPKTMAGADEDSYSRLGAFEVAGPFDQLNIVLNDVPVFERPLYEGVDFALQTAEAHGGSYNIPNSLYDARTYASFAGDLTDAGRNGVHSGIFSPVTVPFLLEASVGRSPILVRHVSKEAPDTHVQPSTRFDSNAIVWIEKAESLLLSATRSRVL